MIEAPLVDCHTHIWTKGMPLVDKPRHRPNYEFTVEQYLTTLDAHGVRYGVLAAASIFGTYNDYTIAAVRTHKRLRGTVMLAPSVDVHTMKRMNDDGIVGVRLPWIALETMPSIDTPEYRVLLRNIADLGWHIHLHLGLGRLPELLPHVEKSGVRIVVDHFGYPDPKLGVSCPNFQAVLKSIDTERTWVKLSGGYRVGRDAAKVYARELLKTAGPERLVWGSDAPFAGFESETTYQQTIDDLVDWVPDPVARRLIGAETPMQLYFGGRAP
jgi:predicted TIM-barrel fold metal-dependent hydrolase